MNSPHRFDTTGRYTLRSATAVAACDEACGPCVARRGLTTATRLIMIATKLCVDPTKGVQSTLHSPVVRNWRVLLEWVEVAHLGWNHVIASGDSRCYSELLGMSELQLQTPKGFAKQNAYQARVRALSASSCHRGIAPSCIVLCWYYGVKALYSMTTRRESLTRARYAFYLAKP